jgi:cellulose synthase operon protein C
MSRTAVSCVALAVCLLLAACQRPDEAALTSAAQVALDAGEPATAIVHLKSVLQQNPRSGAARHLLGRALLDAGDPSGAALELDKALELQHPQQQVLPLLGQAMLASGQAQKFIAAHGDTVLADPGAMAELKSSLAGCFLSLGQLQRARDAVHEAARLSPQHPAVLMMQARLLVREQDVLAARALVAGLVASEPGKSSAEAWRLHGDLNVAAGEPPLRAAASYRQALALKKSDLSARASLVAALIQAGALDEAAHELAPLRAAAKDSVRTQLLQAQLAIERKDFTTARELSHALVHREPDLPRVRELAGALDAHDGALQQAEVHLQRALRADPQSVVARRLLTQTYLRSGQPQRALTTLRPLLDHPGTPPAELLALAAEAQLQMGDAQAAEVSFRRAAEERPGDPRLRTGLALARQAQGHGDEALASLRATAAADSGTHADLALIRLLSGHGRWDEALAAVDKLAAKTPGQPLAAHLRGQIELRRNNLAAARAAFDGALAADKAYFPAIAHLVRLDLRDQQPDAARARLRRLLKADPGHYQGLLMLAELQAQFSAPRDEVRRLVTQAIDSRPDLAEPRVLLVNHHLTHQDPQGALAAAQQAMAALPEDPQVLDAMGRARLASGDGGQALATFRKLASAQPASPAPWLRMAEAHLLLDDRAGSRAALQRALSLQPGSLDAQRGLILLALESGDRQQALQLSRRVQQQRPEQAVGHVLEGDVEAARRQWDAAAAAYRRALARGGGSDVAVKLHATLLAADGAARPAAAARAERVRARQFASEWLAAHPRDAQFLIALGDHAVASDDLQAAEQHYQRAADLHPRHPQALNNLAWVLAKQKKPQALAHAEEANRLLPDRPELLDTWALALAQAGQLPRALEMQRKALSLAPNNPLLRFNLAKLYIQAGQKSLAREELQQVARAGSRFQDQAAVKDLLAGL